MTALTDALARYGAGQATRFDARDEHALGFLPDNAYMEATAAALRARGAHAHVTHASVEGNAILTWMPPTAGRVSGVFISRSVSVQPGTEEVTTRFAIMVSGSPKGSLARWPRDLRHRFPGYFPALSQMERWQRRGQGVYTAPPPSDQYTG